MDKRSEIIACVSWIAFAAPCIWTLKWSWLSLIPLAVQALAFWLQGRQSLISFGASLMPAGLVFVGLRLSSVAWLVVGGVLALALAVSFRTFMPQTAPRTDRWLGVLVILEGLALVSLAAFAI